MNGFRQAIDVATGSNHTVPAYGAVVAFLAVTSVILADITWPGQLLAGTLIGLLAWRELRRCAPAGRFHIVRAVLWQDGSWQVFAVGREPIGARLVRHWGGKAGPMIALEWSCEDGVRRRAWLWRTDLPPVTWRRLRVRLTLA